MRFFYPGPWQPAYNEMKVDRVLEAEGDLAQPQWRRRPLEFPAHRNKFLPLPPPSSQDKAWENWQICEKYLFCGASGGLRIRG